MKDKLNFNVISFVSVIVCLGLFVTALSSRNLILFMDTHYHIHPFTPILFFTLITLVLGIMGFSSMSGRISFLRSLLTILLTVGLAILITILMVMAHYLKFS